MTFSERYGHVQVRTAVQLEELDEATRRGIWNVTYGMFFVDRQRRGYNETVRAVFLPVWLHILEKPADEYPGADYVRDHVKSWITNAEWYLVYDLVELLAIKHWPFAEVINQQLATFNAGYRLLETQVVPISDATELSEIESAIGSKHEGTRHHLKQALEHLADRENPDYPNSIKESISAVESKAGQLTGKSTLGKALDEMKKSGPYVHPSLIEGWKKIYGWASDEDGLRHGGDSAPTADQDLARYMLVSCSAFVNLLTAAELRRYP